MESVVFARRMVRLNCTVAVHRDWAQLALLRLHQDALGGTSNLLTDKKASSIPSYIIDITCSLTYSV
jgi:hypothetical protein